MNLNSIKNKSIDSLKKIKDKSINYFKRIENKYHYKKTLNQTSVKRLKKNQTFTQINKHIALLVKLLNTPQLYKVQAKKYYQNFDEIHLSEFSEYVNKKYSFAKKLDLLTSTRLFLLMELISDRFTPLLKNTHWWQINKYIYLKYQYFKIKHKFIKLQIKR